MESRNTDIITQNKVIIWIALATGLILLVPLVAMQFTDEVNWTVADFVVIGVLLFGTGLVFVLAARRVRKKEHRIAIGVVLAAALLWIWVELAVGLFTSWGS